MRDLKVMVNGVAADIGSQSDFKIAIFKGIFDFTNPTSQGGDYILEVVFPHTKTNDLIFGATLADTQTVNKFRSVVELDVEIFSGGQRVFKGRPIVEKASRTQGYSVRLFSVNIDWANTLANKSLRELTLPLVPFTGSRIFSVPVEPVGAVRAEDIWPLDQSQTIISFAPIAYGNFFQSGGGQSGLLATRVQDIGWQAMPPLCFVVPVVRAIFKQIGYSMAGGFFDTDFAKQLYTAYVGDTAPQWNWGFLARANASKASHLYHDDFVSTDYDFLYVKTAFWRLRTAVENWDYADTYFITSPDEQYVTAVTGVYRFTLSTSATIGFKNLGGAFVNPIPYDFERHAWAIVIIPDDTDELDALKASINDYISDATVTVVSDPNIIAFWDFGTGYEESPYTLLPFTTGGTWGQIVTGVPGTPGAELNGGGTLELTIEGVNLPLGTRVEFWLCSQHAEIDPLASQDWTLSDYTVDVKETSYPDLLNPAMMLPDVSQMDYIKGLITLFNLCYSVDQDRKVIRIDTRDNFYRNNQFANDWTANGDASKGVISPIPFYRRSEFNWGADSGDALHTIFGIEAFNELRTSEGIHAINETEQVVPLFAATYDREFQFKGLAGAPLISRIVIPCMASQSQLDTVQDLIEWDYGYQPRILMRSGMQAGYWRHDGQVFTEYPAARFSFNENGSVAALPFAQGAGRFIRGGGVLASTTQNDGLYRTYWRRFMELRERGHLMSLDVVLDASEFAKAEVSMPIKIAGIHYWLYAFEEGFDPIGQGQIRVTLIRQV